MLHLVCSAASKSSATGVHVICVAIESTYRFKRNVGMLPPTSLNLTDYTSSDGLLALTVAGFDTW